MGDVNLDPAAAFCALLNQHGAANRVSEMSEILWQIRVPRMCIAMLVGFALAISGYLLQSLSRNALADPYLTGVSSGSCLAVAVAMIAGVNYSMLPLLAFVGGLVTSVIVAMLAKSTSGISISRLLLAGVGLSAICGAIITMILVHTSLTAQGQGLFFWLYGGIAGRTWNEFFPASVCTLLGAATAFAMTKQIRLLSLGTDSAASLGLDVSRTQWVLLSAAVLMCGAAVSVSGLVGFVGLIAPHLARLLFGRDERMHLITAGIIGMVLVLLSDLAARTLGQGQELPLGTLLSLVGGPFFLILISRKSKG